MTLVEINTKFKKQIQQSIFRKYKLTKNTKNVEKLNKDENKTLSKIEFMKKNKFIYHIKEVEKFCISSACE